MTTEDIDIYQGTTLCDPNQIIDVTATIQTWRLVTSRILNCLLHDFHVCNS